MPTIIYAAYNPFFSDKKATESANQIQKPKPKPIPQRKSLKMTYFEFIESTKGKFALVSFNSQNIVIRKNDSLYIDE